MNKNIFEQIGDIGILPVVVIDKVDLAEPLAKALCDGGLPCAEITFRTESAQKAIQNITRKFPEMLVGAGTILTIEQVDEAVAAGAKFVVSPGLNEKVVTYCIEKRIPIIPGVATPTEVEKALELGLEVVKFFPANQAGGLPMIKAMSAPYSKIKFMPTGGISKENLREYLDFSKVLACGGSWMVKKELTNTRQFDKIKKLTKEAIDTMLGLHLKNISFKESIGNPKILESLGIGLTKESKECLVASTKDMKRTIAYFERQGIVWDYETASTNSKDEIISISMKEKMGALKICLVQEGLES